MELTREWEVRCYGKFYAIFQFLGSSWLIFHYLPATGKEKWDTTEGPLGGRNLGQLAISRGPEK